MEKKIRFYMIECIALLGTVIFTAFIPQEDPYACQAKKIESVSDVRVYQVGNENAYFYTSGMYVDADGSPRAYHPDDTGLDALKHAKVDGEWHGIVIVDGEPVIQGPNDPAPGYYVSQTSLADNTYQITDPRRYINAERIPYIVLPLQVIEATGARLGDFAVVYNSHNDWYGYAILADVGPPGKLGEGSMLLAEKLGIDKNPRHGGVADGITYVVFPRTGNEGPRAYDVIHRKSEKLLNNLGTMHRVKRCIKQTIH